MQNKQPILLRIFQTFGPPLML